MFYRFWLRFLPFFHLLYHLSLRFPRNLFSCHIALSSLEVISSACISLRPSLVDTIPHFLETLALQYATIDEQFSETIDALAACERVLFGGCALSSKAFETLSELGLKLASQYGQTELSGMVLLGVSFCFASFLVSIVLIINALSPMELPLPHMYDPCPLPLTPLPSGAVFRRWLSIRDEAGAWLRVAP